jgi:SanA protein
MMPLDSFLKRPRGSSKSRWPMVKVGLLLVVGMATLGALMVAGALLLRRRYATRIYEAVGRVPSQPVAIVFGAGVYESGRLSAVLADRVWTAVTLYKVGRVQKLLMTGDNRFVNYNEPQRMKEYAMGLGVPESDIVLDYAGRRTYDSCYRAVHIFEVPSAILVTQRFHLPRALLIAEGLGLEAVGFVADRRPYLGTDWYVMREIPATLVAWVQANVTRPKPILGKKLPIFPNST